MRIILKILLFPLTLALTIAVALGRFLCIFSGALLNVLTFVIFTIAVLSMLIAGATFMEGLRMIIIAWMFSSFGLPLFASLAVEAVDAFNDKLKSI